MSNQTNGLNTAHFFVDEAGDLNLFDRKGRVLLGQEGVSDAFMVGVAHVANMEAANAKLVQRSQSVDARKNPCPLTS